MNIRRLLVSGILVGAALAPFGCGSSDSDGKPSVEERLEKAKAMSDPATRATTFLKLADELEESGAIGTVDEVLFLAGKSCEEIEDPRRRAETTTQLAVALHQQGKKNDAKDLTRQINEAVSAIEDSRDKVSAATVVASAYATTLDRKNSAVKLLSEAQTACGSIEAPEFRVEGFIQIAKSYESIGNNESRDEVVKEALQFAGSIEDARKKADSYTLLAACVHHLKSPSEDLSAADELYVKATAVANDLSDPNSRAFALLGIAKSAKSTGRSDLFAKSISAAEESAKAIQDSSDRNLVMKEIDRMRGN